MQYVIPITVSMYIDWVFSAIMFLHTEPLSCAVVVVAGVVSSFFKLPGEGLSVVPLPAFFLTSCSADLISSSVTPWVERRVSRTRFA